MQNLAQHFITEGVKLQNMKVDYMKPSPWKRVPIKDRTKNKYGLPTFLAMERKLNK